MLNPYGAKGNYYVDSISMKQACATANFDFEVIFISRDAAITERSGAKHTKGQLEVFFLHLDWELLFSFLGDQSIATREEGDTTRS